MRAIKRAYDMSGIAPIDLDYLHTHDCSHIMSLVMAEEIGYLPAGRRTEGGYWRGVPASTGIAR